MSPVHDPRFSSTRWRENLEADAQWSAERTKRDYLIALGMTVVGLIVFIIQIIAQTGEPLSTPAALITWGVLVVGASVLGIGALYIVCAIFGDDAGSIGLAFLRLMGTFSVALVAFTFLEPVGCLALIVAGGVIAVCVAVLFDWDGKQGMAFAAIMLVLWIGLSFVLTAILFALANK
jgi:hypothetical protein